MANAVQVKLPEIGDGIDAGDILDIFVAVGDVVEEGQDIVEIETDKATVPVPSSAAGKVVNVLVSRGQSVPIGGVLIEIEAAGDGPEPAAPVAEKETAEKEKAEPKKAEPAAAESKKSEPEEAPEASAEESDGADSAADPQPTATDEPATQDEPKSKPSATKATDKAPATEAKPKPAASSKSVSSPKPEPAGMTPPPAPATQDPGDDVIPAGPAIRRFAREVGVDLASVVGTGEGGRITRDDVLAIVRQASQAVRSGASGAPQPAQSAPSQTPSAAQSPEGGASDDYGPIRVERMSKIRKTIAAQMHASWSSVPRVTNFDDADISDLERLRQSSKEDYAAQGLKLTTMPFLIKAVATALRHHPSINATLDRENDQIIYKDYVNVGVAVDTDRGLVVPVMRNVDRMGIPEIARALAEVAGKVRGAQFGVNDLRGGTFTISNLGAIGGQYSTPIVNIPEVAILLVGRSRKLPVVMPDDSIKPRLMMPLSLSYDHRLVDGGTAARFLNDVIGYLEAPSRLLLAL